MAGVTPLQRARAALRASHAFISLRSSLAGDDAGDDTEGLLDRQARTVSLDSSPYSHAAAAHPQTESISCADEVGSTLEEGRMANGLPPRNARRNSDRAVAAVEGEQADGRYPLVLLSHTPHLREAPLMPSLRPLLNVGPDGGPGDPEEPGDPPPGWIAPKTDAAAVWHLFTSSYMNLLLVSVPLGFLAQYLNWGAPAIFSLNFLSLVPLALVLGEVTEDLALRFGDTVGGLLNATFGNVVELILSACRTAEEPLHGGVHVPHRLHSQQPAFWC
eukprot:jgi/Botrbrau1/4837/Bobra.0325s0048.1